MSEPVAIARQDGRGMITLRADLAEVRVTAALDVPPVRKIVTEGDTAVAWMAPDELMLFVPAGSISARIAAIEAALDGLHHLVVDVSDARVIFRLEGAGAREVLAKGAPVDLAAAHFGPGDFRRTRLGQVAVALWMPEPDVFGVMCFRSVAGHVATWLDLAARPGTLPGVLGGARPA